MTMTESQPEIPVPITVWRLPAAEPGQALPLELARRIVVEYARDGAPMLDLTRDDVLAEAARECGRARVPRTLADFAVGSHRTALIVLCLPRPGFQAGGFFAGCAAKLVPFGRAVVILAGADFVASRMLADAAAPCGLRLVRRIKAFTARHHADVLVFRSG
ncbi:hypothetical protein [Actinoplanes lobatus]|uniref:Uncharacterized protein n=1 Tax=Actinoplanes lobatus TaxID=113568 RepID=A0A7W7MJK0_9ACTN|nr:hypothetical protein [Actinoplanes lobatus]MBB4752538.1 hypothetical protein [Actinoplanes lobatus]